MDNLSLYNKHLLKVFKAFVEFCDANDLNYFCCGGTAIGALRHKGMIPWDDDIDVFMPREDFEKILKLKTSAEEKGYSIASFRNGTYNNLFLKFYDMNTTLWEIKEIPFILGVYIDIFPLDTTNDSKEEFLRKFKKRKRLDLTYQITCSNYSFSSIINYYKTGDKKYFYKSILSLFIPKILKTYLQKKLIKIDDEYKKDKGVHLISPYGSYYEKEYLEKEWFKASKKVPFEDFEVKIGVGTHEYLTQIYGNYMKLPPVEKQVSHHYHYYLNLEKGLTMEEVKQEINNNNKNS